MIWRRFRRDARGNIAVLFALGFAVSAVVGAVAVDAASLYHERRMIQNGVDLAALAAASDPAQALAIAEASLVEAGLLPAGSTDGLSVVTGHYDPNPATAAALRFTPGQTPLNAVQVGFERPGSLHFARSWTQSPTIGATAIATVTPQVSFSIGSRLASLSGGVANAVLNSLLGTSVALTALDYNGLVGAKVDAFRFLDALAIELGVSAGTYNDLLGMSAHHGKLAAALASILTGAERTAALKLAAVAGHNGVVPLGKLFKLGKFGDFDIGSSGAEGLFTSISALDLLAASAGLSDGNRQVALSLTAGVPGLLGLDVSLAVGQPPQGGSWYAIGPSGTVVRTAQVRLRVVATVLGTGALVGAPIRLPLYVEVAHAEAIVGAATCPAGIDKSGTATILTRPGVLRVMVGEVTPASFGNFNTTPSVGLAKLVEVKLLGLTLLEVLASSVVEVAQTTPVPLSFSAPDIAARTVKTAKTTTVVSSLTSSLLGNLNLQVPILGLGLNLSSLGVLLKAILSPVAPTLDLTINRLLEALGLAVGEADVRVYGVRCSNPVLVG
ncbi:TadG family pilus assembly protein [Devosia lacusdianchii]|uniref:TadG family pilus assembly protein n=1 Tax=Devosia lacusdianchii TaxID=2917991 RepID=UPI001F058811|nr:TadG family pilus assembly protein [Devosia sp. JXJ CY 41]